jgi:beta-N-acetylhexosaminidase
MVSPGHPHAAIMLIIKRIGVILIWFAGMVFVFAAAKNDPYLISLRGPGNIVLVVIRIAASIHLIRRGFWRRRGAAGRLLVLLWCLPSLSMLCAHGSYECASGMFSKRRLGRCEALGSILS